jgi:sugar fermentation stimulation protein A
MYFDTPLVKASFITRYKRFFTDMRLDDGSIVTAHCPSTGSMRGLLMQDALCYLKYSADPKRKLAYTWEMIENRGTLVGINTQNPNRLIAGLLQSKQIPELSDYQTFKPEVKYGENSKIDFYLTDHTNGEPPCFLEIKNVHDREGDMGTFPDSVTTRGQKHLHELITKKNEGYRCMVIYVIQRNDVTGFAPAGFIDKKYAELYTKSRHIGVEHLALRFQVTPDSIAFNQYVPTLPPLN